MCQIQKGEAIFKLAVWVYTKFLICSNLVVLIRSPHLVTKQKKLKPHRWKLLIVHVLQYMRFSFSPISVYIFHISKLIKLPQNKSEKNTHCIQLQVIISIKNGRQQPSLTLVFLKWTWLRYNEASTRCHSCEKMSYYCRLMWWTQT